MLKANAHANICQMLPREKLHYNVRKHDVNNPPYNGYCHMTN